MSTDDSVSEDVSSSGPLSHCQVSADGDVGKESEASLLSSEATTASGLAVSEDRCSASQPTGGTVASQPMKITPACDKIRGLCLSTEEAFTSGRNLPFINPSSLETLRALVKEIRSGGETDPEIWKDCEGRWLHLFQLVEKQYQEQILAQQEQYQCQIQLIQDEIKALVQLQNRQVSIPPHSDFPQTATPKTGDSTKNFILPFISAEISFPRRVASDSLAAPALSPFSSPSPPPQRSDTANPSEERVTTILSSGYGTLSAWETEAEQRWSASIQEDSELVMMTQQEERDPSVHQHRTSGQVLTSWALRQKLRPKKSKTGQSQTSAREELPHKNPESARPPLESTDSKEQHPASASSSGSSLPRRDSFLSDASGFTYWRLNESDLYHTLPDSLDGGAYLLREVSTAQALTPHLSLREIYQHKQRTAKPSDWERADTTSPLQVAAVATTRRSDRSSTLPSPSRFISLRRVPPLPPDSMAEYYVGTDGISEVSQEVAPSSQDKTCLELTTALLANEEAGHTHSSTLKPGSLSGAAHRTPPSSSLEDPVILSLLRQNLREKHSRHVADLKAYYESEIKVLRDKLDLRDLPGDLEPGNRVLAERCEYLEKALAEATRRINEVEASNVLQGKKLAEWPERYAVAGAAVKSLRQRLEDSKRSAREKDATAARLRGRTKQQEAAALKARREADESEAARAREGKMMKELLAEYNGVLKDNNRLKNNFLEAENKLFQANDQISDMKRTISKLECQVRQLEHENQARVRHIPHSISQSSGAGLYHHPDLLRSPSRGNTEPDVTHRRSPCLEPDPLPAGRKSPFQSSQSGGKEAGGWSQRCASPQGFRHVSPQSTRQEEESPKRRETTPSLLTPIMRCLMEMEETRATESKAPWLASERPALGVMELRHKSPLQERVDHQPAGREVVSVAERRPLRPQRSLSPDGLRSSLLPPPGLRSIDPTTPTKRETLLAPLSAKSSPKRCPTENYSTAFGHMMPREEHLHTSEVDQRHDSFHSGSTPRKRLHFSSGDTHLGCEEGQQNSCEDSSSALGEKVQSLAEAEKLFDELTQEKLQIEAALSRMPASSGRASMQTRLDEVALEDRLERLNRDLGWIRMTLKRVHVLRSSANT